MLKLNKIGEKGNINVKEHINDAQLSQIIAEVERLAQNQQADLSNLNKQAVAEILQELNLPPELLDEAIIQLRRREALAKQQTRNKWIVVGVTMVLIGAIASTTFYMYCKV